MARFLLDMEAACGNMQGTANEMFPIGDGYNSGFRQYTPNCIRMGLKTWRHIRWKRGRQKRPMHQETYACPIANFHLEAVGDRSGTSRFRVGQISLIFQSESSGLLTSYERPKPNQ